MNNSKTVIDRLRELIALECKAAALADHDMGVGKALSQEMATARAAIPTAILGHHDRMRARGKKSVAAVRNGICGGCHLKLPISHSISLNPENDIEVCDNCGVFLYVEPVQETSTPSPLAPTARRTAIKRSKTAKKATATA